MAPPQDIATPVKKPSKHPAEDTERVTKINGMPFKRYSQGRKKVVYACNTCLSEKKNADVLKSCSLATVTLTKIRILRRCHHVCDK